MALGKNKCNFMGYISSDIKPDKTGTGVTVVTFRLCSNEVYYHNRQKQERKTFVPCKAYGRHADNISKYCSKGSALDIEARYEQWTQKKPDGTTVYGHFFVIEEIRFLPSKTGGNAPEDAANRDYDDLDPGAAINMDDM